MSISRYFKCVQRTISTLRNFSPHIDVSKEVQHALDRKLAIVALESTIITHGMPYPQNLQTALEVEDLVRGNGAVPATIAIMDGRIKVGLSKNSMEVLASKNSETIKCSRRDLAYIVSQKKTGGTTVSGTMVIAQMLGLKVFATGGIGGVHRNGQDTLDISADLVELGRTPITVVCSGVKSILDIPRTLEFLETQGVCVTTYGDANGRFPDFYTRDSGCRISYNLSGPKEAAQLIKTVHELKMESGILIAVPIPEAFALDKKQISVAIDEAYENAKNEGVQGKDVTPHILAAISNITKGISLEANMALIKNNASVAAQIAKELYRNTVVHASTKGDLSDKKSDTKNVPLVIGASILDLSMTMEVEMPKQLIGATYPAQIKQSAGGVGRNLAEGIYKLHGQANFISAVGNDELGRSLLSLMPSSLCRHITIDEKKSTSLCSVIFDRTGDCKLILGNMEIHGSITPEIILEHESTLKNAPLIVIDSNISEKTFTCVLQLALRYKRPVFFEPTDMLIAAKPFSSLPSQLLRTIRMTSPNIYELKKIAEVITGKNIEYVPDTSADVEVIVEETKKLLKNIQNRFDCIIVTLGQHGVIVCVRSELKDKPLYDAETGDYLVSGEPKEHSIRFYAAPHIEKIKNVSGAGDSFSSGFITGLLRGSNIDQCVALGMQAAQCALQSHSAVPKTYSIIENEHSEAFDKTKLDFVKM